ncbi:uncharacterized protein C8R40DRAFT_1123300 [Lentinula edodes]|uniref:uncharacterized protein n=1 Tax=Lentinula edodes TaxID=5353 RepID=UPI001E8DD20C|nr:uncharacterized protein C8R40DRAFT_1123300 [Lentinula edodes]KAH7871220.1 hypothetical protein C8R40DRAFT_1123300 [Lentinula edodes]
MLVRSCDRMLSGRMFRSPHRKLLSEVLGMKDQTQHFLLGQKSQVQKPQIYMISSENKGRQSTG